MDHGKFEELLKKRMPMFVLIFGQFMLTPLILSGVTWMMVGQRLSTGSAAGEPQQTAMILAVLGAGLLLLADNIGNIFAKNFKPRRALSPEDDFLNSQFTRSLIVFAILEGSAIVGFVASWITGEVIWSAVFSLLTILAMLREMPSAEKIRSAARQAPGEGK